MPESVAYPSRRVSQPTGDKQRKEERSLHKLQSPGAKLSNLFARCQEICHRNVTTIVPQQCFWNGVKLIVQTTADIAAGNDTEATLGWRDNCGRLY
jgi:hypothetical protein